MVKIVLVIIVFVILVDRITKIKAKSILKYERKELLSGKVQFYLVKNYGAFMNIFSNKRKIVLFSSITGIMLMTIYFFMYEINSCNNMLRIGYSFFIGGGISNTIERIKDGYVTDFIYFKIKKFPVFNIADFFIFAGFFIIMIKSI